MNYDIIGDIHGQANRLLALLEKLGYQDHAGAWRHPHRSAIFVGDFIDRGPDQLETINIVRRMIDAGSAMAIMGNHEFNAVAWYHGHRDRDANREQHQAFLAEVEHDPELHQEQVEWFLTLPLWLDLPDLRVVHACWHPGHLELIEPLLKPDRLLDLSSVEAASRRGTIPFLAVDALLKGLEVKLPAGHEFRDNSGKVRHHVRVRWWDKNATTFRKAALLEPHSAREALPDLPVPLSARVGYESAKPLFFGHYWFSGVPAPIASNIACVDYSGNGGPLVAYRWEGQAQLSASGFVSV